MNLIARKYSGLALLALVASAALGTGCNSPKKSDPVAQGKANVGVTMNALQATGIVKMTLTISTDASSGAPTFAAISTDLTNNDPSNRLTWSTFVQGIPAGTQRLFSIQAFDASSAVVYSGSARADIVAGGTASVFIVLQGLNDGGFQNSLPVVTSLSSSANVVTVGTTPPPAPVALSFSATDPDAAATLTYAWADSCGSSFDAATGSLPQATATTVHWTAPATVPASGACTLTLKITDNKQGTVTAVLAIQIQANTNGSANVAAYPNSWPMISGIVVNETFAKNAQGQIVSVEYDLVASAGDTDGDDLKYTWTIDPAHGCNKAGDGYTATTPAVPTATLNLAYGQGQIGSSTVHFHTTDLGSACVLKLDVTDFWKNGIVPLNSGLPVARGGDTLGVINGSLAKDFAIAPLITKFSSPNAPTQSTPNSAHYIVNHDQTVQLAVEVSDPTPAFNAPGTPFTFTWIGNGGAFVAGSQSDVTASPGKSTISWTAASSYAPGSKVMVTVTSAQGLSSTYTWFFDPANPCDGTAASVGLACNTGLGLCAPAGKCTLAGACVDPNAVVCAAPTQCQQAGVCQPATGICAFAPQVAGTTCNADGNGCTQNDACNGAGACVAGAAVVCNTPADAQCQSAAGTCTSTGNNTFSCNYVAATNGTACNKDSNGCTQNDSCQAGVCSAGAPVVCSNTTNSCQAAAGTCTSTGTNSFACSFANVNEGGACNTAGPCITGQACTAGACTGGTPFCPAGTSCQAGPPLACVGTIVAPQVAKDLPISGPAGVAVDTAGNAFVAAGIFGGPFSLDGKPVSSTGDADIVVAKYGPNGTATWAVTYGEATNPQFAVGTAVTNDGTVAVVGSFAGTFSIGPGSLSNASPIDFLAGLNSTDGSGKFAKQFDDGANGVLKAVAANPNDASAAHGNRIAVCGLANGGTPTNLVGAGAVAAAANDVIIAVFKSDGTKLWASQFSSPGTANEECDAVAIDDNGDVWAAGSTSGASINFGGATGVLTGPNASTRKFTWVAKFNGATGAAITSAIFGGTGGQATPAGIAVDASGNVALAGQFTGNVTFGGTALTSAGLADAWAAKLNGAAVPTWAVRLGGAGGDVANGVAVTSFGNVVVTGSINKGPTTGAAALTAASTTAPDAFILKLNGGTGSTDFAANYGDAANQTGDAIAVNRFGATPNQIAVAGSITSGMTFPAPAGSITAVNPTDVFVVFANLQ
jgi:hypothetical protein